MFSRWSSSARMTEHAPANVWRRARWKFCGFASDPSGNIIYRRSFKGSGRFSWDVHEDPVSGTSYPVHIEAAQRLKKDSNLTFRSKETHTGARAFSLKTFYLLSVGVVTFVAVQEYIRFKFWLNPPARVGLVKLEEKVLHVPRKVVDVLPVNHDAQTVLHSAYSQVGGAFGYNMNRTDVIDDEAALLKLKKQKEMDREKELYGTNGGGGVGWSTKSVVLACITAVTLWML
eukprot:PhF_6_TR6702/c0_g1_i1/m.9727